MKAIVITEFGGPEVLKIQEVDIPVINKKQVLIRVIATSVNFADIQTRRGLYHAGGKPPLIPGLDVAGVIEKVGRSCHEIRSWPARDRVSKERKLRGIRLRR